MYLHSYYMKFTYLLYNDDASSNVTRVHYPDISVEIIDGRYSGFDPVPTKARLKSLIF